MHASAIRILAIHKVTPTAPLLIPNVFMARNLVTNGSFNNPFYRYSEKHTIYHRVAAFECEAVYPEAHQ